MSGRPGRCGLGLRPRTSDVRKQSAWFDPEVLAEITAQALRMDRSISWIVQRAWKLAREEIRSFPTAVQMDEEDTDRYEMTMPAPPASPQREIW